MQGVWIEGRDAPVWVLDNRRVRRRRSCLCQSERYRSHRLHHLLLRVIHVLMSHCLAGAPVARQITGNPSPKNERIRSSVSMVGA